MECIHHHETGMVDVRIHAGEVEAEIDDVVVNTAELEAALGRRWTLEDSRRILRRTDLQVLIEDSKSSDEYHQALEDQIRQFLGQNCNDYLVQDVLLLCELTSARDKRFLKISINRSGWSDEDEDDLSCDGEIMDHLSIRVCDEDEEEEICSICLEYLYQQHGTIATLKCWHEFHADCINKWLLGPQNFCPLCKKDATHHQGRIKKIESLRR
ncbi:hypothetical protein C2S52_022011 [Perilla frutescens var. hirtella]|nr:hypothetical protein C2S52_022011 [Perilla frutescens var. hirtella]